MQTLLIHITNEEPILAEAETLPLPSDQVVVCLHPRRRDGREVHYVLPEVQTIIIPWHRISFIEVMPSGQEEEIISPFGV